MPNENPVYIRLDYNESLEARRGILYSEMSSLKIAQKIERYATLRMAEFSVKLSMYSKMKEIRLGIKKLQDIIPVPKIPGILKRPQISQKPQEKEDSMEPNGDIESQLRQIQKRLEELQGRS